MNQVMYTLYVLMAVKVIGVFVYTMVWPGNAQRKG